MTLRYWFFALVATAWIVRKQTGSSPRPKLSSAYPILQVLRGALLIGQICLMVWAYTLIGLVESYAVFASYPLFVAATSFVFLGERVRGAYWFALLTGFIGVIIILSPGSNAFSWFSLVPLAASVMNATYGLLTRYVGTRDAALTSFFWVGVSGAALITPFGLLHWETLQGVDWIWMLLLCMAGAGSHYLLIRAYEVAEAVTIQPLAYMQLLWITLVGMFLFHESLRTNVLLGGCLVVGAGLFTLWRNGKKGGASS